MFRKIWFYQKSSEFSFLSIILIVFFFFFSTVLYMKFVFVWVVVIIADFLLEFRFEFLWPFYLLLRSVYDSFKYQGLAFSIFFVCIALTSDMLCFFFIPVQWLFFAASTYVWVQYIWHTDKTVCVPTLFLSILFIYFEAAVRLKDFKQNMNNHLHLCRPFAAHCIGKCFIIYYYLLSEIENMKFVNDIAAIAGLQRFLVCIKNKPNCRLFLHHTRDLHPITG